MNYVKEFLLTTLLLSTAYSQCDANGDGDLNVLDVVIEVDCILTDCWEGDLDTIIVVVDIDGNYYTAIPIGAQWWMTENLKVTHYNDGSEITHIINDEDWGSAYEEGQYGIYDNAPANADIYGNLYNWFAVDDERGICPEGWHVPSDEEYTILTNYLGGESVAGGKMKETGLDHWNSPNTGATNESGFTALPAGYRFGSQGTYYYMGNGGYFWSSSEYAGATNSIYAWLQKLDYSNSIAYRYFNLKQTGFSIRCLGD